MTQGSGTNSLNESLVARIEGESGAEVVSPEVLAFSTLRGTPVVVRGARPGPFLELEGGTTDVAVGDPYALVGQGLAVRLGLAAGDRILLTGSIAPKFLELEVTGTFATATPANDEILTHPDAARDLAGVGPGTYHQVRVRTSDFRALHDTLVRSGASVHVFAPGPRIVDVNSDPVGDDRITNLLLRAGTGTVSPDRLSGAVSQVSNSVRVVVLGLLATVVALVAVGIHSVHARVTADALRNVRILKSLGAGRSWIVFRGLRESLPVAFAGAVAGLAAGIALAVVAGHLDLVVVFGHAIRPELTLLGMAAIVLLSVALSLASVTVCLARHTRPRPEELRRETPGPLEPLGEVLP